MMAMWRGSRIFSVSSAFLVLNMAMSLYLEQLFFLLLGDLVDLLYPVVRELLEVLFGYLEVVLGDLRGLLLGLELVHRVAPDVADGDLGVLGVFLDLLCQLLAALLSQLREYQADAPAVVLGVDAQVGGQDGLFYRLERGGIPGLDQQAAGVRRRDSGYLLDGSR